MAPTPRRFFDPRSSTSDFVDWILVVCPACARTAYVVPGPADGEGPGGRTVTSRRLVCRECGLTRLRRGCRARGADAGAWRDPFFGVPLKLQVDTRHGQVWAYNPEHLDLIRRFVQASLRERVPWYDSGRKKTLVARLPAWMKRSGNRDEVLRAVDRIRASLLAG